jgi:membrane-associated protein
LKFVPQPRQWTLLLILGFCLAVAAASFFSIRAGRTARQMRWLDAKAKRWGGTGVFLQPLAGYSLGPWINLASGAAGYSWLQFTLWDSVGESFGAALYIWLGHAFSDRVQELGAILGDLGWAILGLLATAFLGWKLFFNRTTSSTRP